MQFRHLPQILKQKKKQCEVKYSVWQGDYFMCREGHQTNGMTVRHTILQLEIYRLSACSFLGYPWVRHWTCNATDVNFMVCLVRHSSRVLMLSVKICVLLYMTKTNTTTEEKCSVVHIIHSYIHIYKKHTQIMERSAYRDGIYLNLVWSKHFLVQSGEISLADNRKHKINNTIRTPP